MGDVRLADASLPLETRDDPGGGSPDGLAPRGFPLARRTRAHELAKASPPGPPCPTPPSLGRRAVRRPPSGRSGTPPCSSGGAGTVASAMSWGHALPVAQPRDRLRVPRERGDDGPMRRSRRASSARPRVAERLVLRAVTSSTSLALRGGAQRKYVRRDVAGWRRGSPSSPPALSRPAAASDGVHQDRGQPPAQGHRLLEVGGALTSTERHRDAH